MSGRERFRIFLRIYLAAFMMVALISACAGERSPDLALRQSQVSLGAVPGHRRSAHNAYQEPDAGVRQKFQTAFHQLPLSFIPNRGQVDQRVRLYGRSGTTSFFFAPDEVVYSFVPGKQQTSLQQVSRSTPPKDPRQPAERAHQGHVVRIRFVGANQDPVVEGQQELPGKANYFISHDPARWRKELLTYREVRYRELWPGIDLIYRGQEGQLKYEFIVNPGADPRQIQLAYRGIEGIRVSDAGDLILKTASGELRDSRPYVYQEIGGRRVEIEAAFRIQGRDPHGPDTDHLGFVHGFAVSGYDPAYPLILDPGLDYATFLEGNSSDSGHGIALDAEGNAYIVGSTSSNEGIFGAPQWLGGKRVTVQVTDQADASVSKSFQINTFNPLRITTRNLPKGRVGQPYRAILRAVGRSKPRTWLLDPLFPFRSLPEGLSLNRSTGEITGTPTQSGLFLPAIHVTDSAGSTRRSVAITILP